MQLIICLLAVAVVILVIGICYALLRIRQLHRTLHHLVSHSEAGQPTVPPSETQEEKPDDTPADKSAEAETDEVPSATGTSDNRLDQELFEQIHRTIVEEKLFLNPDFSREHVIRLGLINKNKVAQLFRKYAHTNFNGYVNNLRLEYALKLLQQQPDIPVKAVAYDSGFNSIRTFYRIFEQTYGKTPMAYKEELNGKEPSPKETP